MSIYSPELLIFSPIGSDPGVYDSSYTCGTMLMLTDGTIMCHVGQSEKWFRLVPDNTGCYQNGSWEQLSSMSKRRLYFASAILPDGRVLVLGGEYSAAPGQPLPPNGNDDATAEIFDPAANAWSPLANPNSFIRGDAPCCVLNDGRVLFGALSFTNTVIYDPATSSWNAAGANGSKQFSSDEESWVLMQDGSVVTVNTGNIGTSERYLPDQDKWVTAGALPVPLVESTMHEIGPGLVLPDGRAFFVGSTGHTALYTLPDAEHPNGSWAIGPDVNDKNGFLLSAYDAPACLLPDGTVLIVAGAATTENGQTWSQYPTLLIFDPIAATIKPLSVQPSYATIMVESGDTYNMRLMLLPTGSVLVTNDTPNPHGVVPFVGPSDAHWKNWQSPAPAWGPQITGVSALAATPGSTILIAGNRLAGVSQAVVYGDDCSCATNYPVVAMQNTADLKVRFCKTANFSSRALKSVYPQTCQCTLPANLEAGRMLMYLCANGVATSRLFNVVSPSQPLKMVYGGVTGASWQANRLDLFGVGFDAQVYHHAWDGNQWQAGWDCLGGQAASLPAVVSWGPNRLDVFMLAPDLSMLHQSWNGSAWQPSWDSLAGVFASSPAVVSWGPNRLDIFGLGTDGAVYHNSWNGSQWQPGGWDSLGGKFASMPCAVSWGPGRIDLFGLGTDMSLYHNSWNGQQWQPGGWDALGGTFSSPPIAVSWGANRIDLFGLGTDNSAYHNSWNGSQWQSQWDPLGGSFSSPLAAACWGANRIDILGRGADGAMYHTAWNGQNWQGTWDSLGGYFLSHPLVLAPAPNRLDVFGLGGDFGVYHNSWNGSQWQSAWDAQGGQLVTPILAPGYGDTVAAPVSVGA